MEQYNSITKEQLQSALDVIEHTACLTIEKLAYKLDSDTGILSIAIRTSNSVFSYLILRNGELR